MTAVEPRPDLADLERPALESALDGRGHKRFHARQIFRWIYKRGVTDVDAMTDLSRELRATLSREFVLTTPALAHRDLSADGGTLPLPVPAELVTSSTADVNGTEATVLTSRNGLFAGVVWVKDGVMTGVAGSLSADELLSVARGLR